MPLVKFVKENKEIDVPHGANLRQEAIKAGINVHQGINGFGASINKVLNCHGIGQCGTCRVLITKGMENTNPMGVIEKIRFYNPVPDPMSNYGRCTTDRRGRRLDRRDRLRTGRRERRGRP